MGVPEMGSLSQTSFEKSGEVSIAGKCMIKWKLLYTIEKNIAPYFCSRFSITQGVPGGGLIFYAPLPPPKKEEKKNTYWLCNLLDYTIIINEKQQILVTWNIYNLPISFSSIFCWWYFSKHVTSPLKKHNTTLNVVHMNRVL